MKSRDDNLSDYSLLDSGGMERLEIFGGVSVRRPDPQALWDKNLSEDHWKLAQAVFQRTGQRGSWHIKPPLPEPWNVKISGLTFSLEPTPSKHIGIFPEQLSQWLWLSERIKIAILAGRPVSVLNLFAYTGGATLASAKAGASVTHVDSSEYAIARAMQNRDASRLSDMPIRFIIDDVRKFVEREIRRGNHYDIILLDPPVYGKGQKKEVWNLEDDLLSLLFKLKKLLSDDPIAMILGGYSSVYSPVTYENILGQITHELSGRLESGELYIQESGKLGRRLPCGIFARWQKS